LLLGLLALVLEPYLDCPNWYIDFAADLFAFCLVRKAGFFKDLLKILGLYWGQYCSGSFAGDGSVGVPCWGCYQVWGAASGSCRGRHRRCILVQLDIVFDYWLFIYLVVVDLVNFIQRPLCGRYL
jgi:hypothetical protein